MSQLKAMYSGIVSENFPETLTIILGDEKLVYKKRAWRIGGETRGLRYGENPDQPAALYQLVDGEAGAPGFKGRSPGDAVVSALEDGQILQSGKHPGKTNLTDVDNGANILQYLSDKPAAVILKHNNPCGAAWNDDPLEAVKRAFYCDRIAAFGGVLTTNLPLSREAALFLSASYFEVVAAPAYEEGALAILSARKNLRILELPGLAKLANLAKTSFLDIKSLSDGGLIAQKSFVNRILENTDFIPATAKTADGVEVVARYPDAKELDDLRFAWAVEAGVASNSAIFARDGATVAIGAGEQDRVGVVELAVRKAYIKFADNLAFDRYGMSLYELRRASAEDEALKNSLAEIEAETDSRRGGLPGSVMVSDGFFPFRDAVDIAIAEGVRAIAHPGGSLRDADSIIACDEAVPQVAMAFTGQRSFKH
ncbi:MAG: IMP cyclohydrolase [Desulfovibrio sp.]|nr:IMP cyclohydrolase [Desulfovibrio sp.]